MELKSASQARTLAYNQLIEDCDQTFLNEIIQKIEEAILKGKMFVNLICSNFNFEDEKIENLLRYQGYCVEWKNYNLLIISWDTQE